MLDWGFVYENIPLYQQALVLTIRLALFGILGAIIRFILNCLVTRRF